VVLCGTWSATSGALSQITILANSKTQNTFLSPVFTTLHHDCPLVVKPANMPWCLLPKQTRRDSLPINMLLSAVSVLVVRLPSLEVLEELMNYPVYMAWTLTGRVLNILNSCIMNIHVQPATLSSHVFVFTIQMKTLEYVQTIHLPRIKSKLQNSISSAYIKQVQDNNIQHGVTHHN
jgi:hypothetical protein